MANRKYQGRSVSGTNDFIHIDLLPNVKRPRQFNVNILLLVLIAVFASWLIIYLPLTTRQDRLDNALEERSDLQYQLILVNEERVGYNIEQERIAYANYVTVVEDLQIDFMEYHDAIKDAIGSQGTIVSVYYSAIENRFLFDIEAINESTFTTIDFAIVDLPFVQSTNYSISYVQGSGSNLLASYEIEVDLYAE
ncbi:MAG: hypothetical protein ACOC1L_07315 [Bacillota bacterium]